MRKFVFSMGAVIALAAMLMLLTSPTHFAKAYSCSSSAGIRSSAAGGSSSSVQGSFGSCSTSSASTPKTSFHNAVSSCDAPNCNGAVSLGGQPSSSSTSGGGSQTSCSQSSSSASGSFQLAISSAQSQKGKCP
jgi:hypothetical protein